MNICPIFVVSPTIKDNDLYIHAQSMSYGLEFIKQRQQMAYLNLICYLIYPCVTILKCRHWVFSNTVRKHKTMVWESLSYNLMLDHQSSKMKTISYPQRHSPQITGNLSTTNIPCVRDAISCSLEPLLMAIEQYQTSSKGRMCFWFCWTNLKLAGAFLVFHPYFAMFPEKTDVLVFWVFFFIINVITFPCGFFSWTLHYHLWLPISMHTDQ